LEGIDIAVEFKGKLVMIEPFRSEGFQMIRPMAKAPFVQVSPREMRPAILIQYMTDSGLILW
jgi:hypothetical protein